MKTLLLISRQSPYGGSYAREALDIALSAAAFDIAVTMLFMDDGVYQLVKDQQPVQGHAKNLESSLSALPLYDINTLLVERESLAARDLGTSDLGHEVRTVGSREIATLASNHDRILTL